MHRLIAQTDIAIVYIDDQVKKEVHALSNKISVVIFIEEIFHEQTVDEANFVLNDLTG